MLVGDSISVSSSLSTDPSRTLSDQIVSNVLTGDDLSPEPAVWSPLPSVRRKRALIEDPLDLGGPLPPECSYGDEYNNAFF